MRWKTSKWNWYFDECVCFSPLWLSLSPSLPVCSPFFIIFFVAYARTNTHIVWCMCSSIWFDGDNEKYRVSRVHFLQTPMFALYSLSHILAHFWPLIFHISLWFDLPSKTKQKTRMEWESNNRVNEWNSFPKYERNQSIMSTHARSQRGRRRDAGANKNTTCKSRRICLRVQKVIF